jgi:hypothetical protein
MTSVITTYQEILDVLTPYMDPTNTDDSVFFEPDTNELYFSFELRHRTTIKDETHQVTDDLCRELLYISSCEWNDYTGDPGFTHCHIDHEELEQYLIARIRLAKLQLLVSP